MALNFDTSKMTCDESVLKATYGQRQVWAPEVESMAFATMAVGINRITEDNADEFYRRYVSWHVAQGHRDAGIVDRATVAKFVGFRTNASTLTPAAFKKRLLERIEDTADTLLENERLRAIDPNAPQYI